MGIFLNSGNMGFRNMLNSKIYVDKTDMMPLLCERINTEQKYICMSRPRRFGKSVAACMIAAYFDKSCDSRPLFEARKLGKLEGWDKYLNKINVIKVDIADIMSDLRNPGAVLPYIDKKLFKELSEQFGDSGPDSADGLAGMLSEVNEKTGEQFVIIIDEWDCLFREDNCSEDLRREYVSFLRGLFKGDRSKQFLALGYITGILPIKRYNSESALNNFSEFTMLQPAKFAPYIGFTTDEVKALCGQYDMDYEQALEWYDGYNLGALQHICGANSVVTAMDMGEYASYWSRTVAFSSLKGYITLNFEGLRDDITAMIGGQKVRVRTDGFQNDMTEIKSRDDALTLLIHLGYLAYDQETSEAYIPNKEVRIAFEQVITDTDWNELVRAINESQDLLRATIAGDEDETAEMIARCHSENTSIIRYNDENSLAACVTIAYYSARSEYIIIRELPSGYGFADMVFIPKRNVTKPAMIVELKWNQNADTAIKQIKERRYEGALKDYAGEILLAGISYEKKGKDGGRHSCVIERMNAAG